MCTDCSCGTADIQAAPQSNEEAIVATYEVSGMTCGHCASSVTKSIGELDGVTSVEVDVPAGSVTVQSTKPLDDDNVRTAVETAGYELTPA